MRSGERPLFGPYLRRRVEQRTDVPLDPPYPQRPIQRMELRVGRSPRAPPRADGAGLRRRLRLGDDHTKINLIDANGVCMVAIQALYRRVAELERQVRELADSSPAR